MELGVRVAMDRGPEERKAAATLLRYLRSWTTAAAMAQGHQLLRHGHAGHAARGQGSAEPVDAVE